MKSSFLRCFWLLFLALPPVLMGELMAPQEGIPAAGGSALSAGKPYVLSPTPDGRYSDSGGELADGVTATGESWANAAGWIYVNPTITLDLGQIYNLTEVQLFVGNSHGNGSYGVYRPASTAVSVSSDGMSFTPVGNLSFSAWSDIGTKNQVDKGVATFSASGRWVRFTIAAGGPWVMVTELVASVAGQPPTRCARAGRAGLSDVAAEALSSIETNQAALADSPVPKELLLSTCNRFLSVNIDGPAIFTAARDMIARAEHEVDIAFYVWEPDSQAARLIGDGLILAQARRTAADPLLVRIVINDYWFSKDPKINDLYASKNMWVSMGLDLSRVELQLATAAGIWPAPLHDKLIVVDARYLLVTGANVELHHDAGSPWHDSGYVLEGDVAQSALAAFEQTWPGDEPERSWLRPFGSQAPGDIPVLAVGRTRAEFLNNDTTNPQDIAWLTLMDRATSHIDVETPNINDDAFQDAVTHAVARGVTVRLITSLGFNDGSEDFVGGDNMEVAGRLRQAIRATAPWFEDRFQLRWYSRDGIEPIDGNGDFASHTKYMTMDNRLAVVGSGNQDTASWNISHEFNILIDDPSVTAHLESSLFLPDWSRAAGSYAELYEGNGGTQDVVCALFVNRNKTLRFFDPIKLDPFKGTDYPCDNDEARSLLLHDVPAGKVLRFYDHPKGQYEDDDWTEIIVKQPVGRKYIDSFEQSFEDADIRVVHHRNNGLDGKISFAEVSTAPVGAVVDLYEGNNGTQNLVCSNRIVATQTIYLTLDAHCDNDEARSLVLYDFPPDKVIFLYDSPGGSRGDDWAIIVPKRRISQATVATFERSFENADFRLCSFPNNGLDGKVSRIRIGSLSEAAGLCGVGGTACPTQGQLCDGPDGDLCREGTIQADCSCGDTSATNVESCNGVDDDCDGTVDEGCCVFNQGVACDGPDGDLCTEGIIACDGSCSDTSATNVEICNGTDDDCDGAVDEGACGGPVSAGKPYVLSPAPASNYPDSGGELTDGVTATGESWVNAAGWIYVNPTITLDLGQIYNLTEVQLFVGNSHGNGSYGVYQPASTTVSVSSDGVSFTPVGNLSFSAWSDIGTKNQVDRGVAAVSASGRWVRFTITAGGPWVMVTEVAVK